MHLVHDIPSAGHLGPENTLNLVLQCFYWLGVYVQVQCYCQACPECQLTQLKSLPRGQLQPMPIITTATVRELATNFSHVGLSCQILTDQGTNFMRQVVVYLWPSVGEHPLQNSIHHSQNNALVEHFNSTLKCMLCKFAQTNPHTWHCWLLCCCLQCKRFQNPQLAFPPSNSSTDVGPRA